MTDPTPDPAPDRPLVTFALFAYNQEQYIREAVEGAFSQTYEPLEIILSDDCSSDRTFEIMQEMAAAYQGPHEVRVRRNEVNLGTLGHVLAVAKAAKGEILVVAAGDDISLPERTKTLVPYFSLPKIAAVSSDDLIINENGEPVYIDEERIGRRDLWHIQDPTWVHGATSAYRVSFLQSLHKSDVKLLYEDLIFSELLKATEKYSTRIKEKLIKYRYHTQNLSSRHEKSIDEAEIASRIRWKRSAEAKHYCLTAVYNLAENGQLKKRMSKSLQGEHQLLLLLSDWPNLSITERFRLIFVSIQQRRVKTVIIRTFGKSFFKLIRHTQQLVNLK